MIKLQKVKRDKDGIFLFRQKNVPHILINSSLLKENTYSFNLFIQGSEIFTVVAKDGDVGNPNPIRYSFDEG